MTRDARLIALEQEFALQDERFDEGGALGEVFEAVSAIVSRLSELESNTIEGLTVKRRIAARLEANGWDDLVEMVARSVARDAFKLTVAT